MAESDKIPENPIPSIEIGEPYVGGSDGSKDVMVDRDAEQYGGFSKTDVEETSSIKHDVNETRLAKDLEQLQMKQNSSPAESTANEWDDTAEIPTIHFSFLINLLIPKHVVTWKFSKAHKEIENINKARRARLGADVIGNNVPVGSVAECYQMPKMISKSGIPSGQNLSDTDILMVWDTAPVREFDKDATPKQKLVLETDGTHPGYALVLINDPKTVLNNVDPDFAILLNDKYYLSARKQRKNAEKTAQMEAMLSKIPLMVEQTGPATSMEDTTSRTLNFFQAHKKVQDRQELVPAIKCQWPSQANDWMKRVSKSGWISQSLAESIVDNGCHLVPVPHKLTKQPDVDWRISFATSEVQLAKEAVTKHQRQCYIYLKLLGHVIMKGKKLISSYHLKTTFLHACENLPLDLWRTNPGYCVLKMLDELLSYVRNRWLPSFFNLDNNLIDHLTDDEFEHLESLIQAARVNPIEPVLAFTDTHVINNHGVTTPFRKNIMDLLVDFEKFKVHRSVLTSIPSFILALNGTVTSILLDNKASEAAAFLVSSFDFLQIFTSESSISKFIHTALIDWKLVIQLVQVFESVLTHADEYPDLLNLRSHLASLYHAASFNFIPGSSKCSDALSKAENIFKSVFKERKETVEITIEYVLLLLTQKKTEEAGRFLATLLDSGRDKSDGNTNSYNSITWTTLTDSLKRKIGETKKFKRVTRTSQFTVFGTHKQHQNL